MVADHSPRTEAGTGALMPWANRLWVITYVAHTSWSGSGTFKNEEVSYKVPENGVVVLRVLST